MSSALVAITLVTAVGSGLASGVFFAFSTFVMPALARISTRDGIVAMQSINVTALNPWLGGLLRGTALTSIAMVVMALADWDASYGPYLLAGGALYLVGTIGVTVACHLPRNDALDAVDATSAEGASYWTGFLTQWTAWNHVRTVAPLVAMGLEIGAIHVG